MAVVRRGLFTAALLVALGVVTGCRSSDGDASSGATPSSVSVISTAGPRPDLSRGARDDAVVGTVIRFTSEDTSVDVTISEDNPTVRDLLSRLPLALTLEEFGGKEKVGRLSPELDTEGSPGSDPGNGDLICFAPWGSLGFFYNADGVGYSDQTIPLGTFDASVEQLARLEGAEVTVEVVD
ncbi:hypothetical protein ASD66_05260 [Nocardioides sp. Root151]|nr:hypothetical protein ASD66_05260 [Nocardioides sp. Root151]